MSDPVKPITPPEEGVVAKVLRFPMGMASRLREMAGIARRYRSKPQPTPLALPKFPPGVAPASNPPDGPKLAMDDDAFLVDSTGWAVNAIGAVNSIWDEGQIFMGFAELAILAQRAEYRQITETIAKEMTREWIEFETGGDEGEEKKTDKIKKIEDWIADHHLKDTTKAVIESDGFYGRGHFFLDFGDDDKTELKITVGNGRNAISKIKAGLKGHNGGPPLDDDDDDDDDVAEDKAPVSKSDHTLKDVRSVEPMWAYPTGYESIDPLKKEWYVPEHWLVMGKEVHKTRFIPVVSRPVADILKPTYAFGGLPLTQIAKPYVDNWLRTRQSVSDLVHNFSVQGISTNLQTLLQPGGQALIERVDFYNAMRDNHGMMLLDKETEDYWQQSVSLASLPELQSQAQEQLAAVSHIPLVILLGLSPHGLNASSEGEIRAFYAWIKSLQESVLREVLTTIIGFIQLALFGEVDPEITFKFKDLWQLDETGQLANEKLKTDIDDANVAMGAITPDDVHARLIADKNSIYRDLDLMPLPDPMDGIEEMGPDGNPIEPDQDDPNAGGGGAKDPRSGLANSIASKSTGDPAGQGFAGNP